MKLSDGQKLIGAKSVTLAELRNTLKLMPKNKTPGNDGLPVEFYLIFFDILGPELLKCINECYKQGTLTISQRQATVTLIEKPGKDNRLLKSL